MQEIQSKMQELLQFFKKQDEDFEKNVEANKESIEEINETIEQSQTLLSKLNAEMQQTIKKKFEGFEVENPKQDF